MGSSKDMERALIGAVVSLLASGVIIGIVLVKVWEYFGRHLHWG